MKISLKNFINYSAVFTMFCGHFAPYGVHFAECRVSYFVMLCVLLLLLPFLKGIYFSKTFLSIFFIISVSSLYNVFIGENTITLFAKQFVGIFTSVCFFYVIIKFNNYDIVALFRVYLNIAFIVALIGVVQEVSYLVKFKSGYDFTYILPFWNWRVSLDPQWNMLRVNSILQEPAHFCNVMMPALFVSLTSFLKDSFKFQPKWKSMIVVLSFFLTFSDAGYVAAFFAILLLAYNYRRIKYIAASLIIVSLLTYYLYNNSTVFRRKLDEPVQIMRGNISIEEDLNQSTYALVTNALVTYASFKKNPIFGTGLGSHEFIYYRYIDKVVDLKKVLKFPNKFVNRKDAASLFLRLISELGLFGLSVFFIFIGRFHINRIGDKSGYLWIINNAVLTMFFIKLLRMGHYFVDGFFFFILIYYFAKKILLSDSYTPVSRYRRGS